MAVAEHNDAEIDRENDLSRLNTAGDRTPFLRRPCFCAQAQGRQTFRTIGASTMRAWSVAPDGYSTTVTSSLGLTSTQLPLFGNYARSFRQYKTDLLQLDENHAANVPRANAAQFLDLKQKGMRFEGDRPGLLS